MHKSCVCVCVCACACACGRVCVCMCFLKVSPFLAHLSQRLVGEFIVYPSSGVRRRRRPSFQTSAPKLLVQSKPDFMWSLLGKG